MTKPSRRASRRRSGASVKRPTAAASPAQPEAPVARQFPKVDAWRWTATAILTGAFILRVYDLSAKVMHHDEGVNGLFMTTLFRSGYYHYDPSNFHGPTLYYFGWVTTTVSSLFLGKAGLSTDALRMVTVLFGMGVIWLLLCLRKELGDFGSLAAAALAAVSPGFVFFSRYFIHEVLFVFFSLGVIVAWLRFRETARAHYLMLGAASAALLGATKETWVITIAVWLLAIPCTVAYAKLQNIPAEPAAALPADTSKLNLYGTAALLFITVWLLFYSSFFTNFPQGVYDSLRTFTFWFKTSSNAHKYSWDEYVRWLWHAEWPTLVLGAMGLAITMGTAKRRFAVFASFWAMGIFAAYSLVPYKTPWLALNITLPLIIVAGYGLEQIYDWSSHRPFGRIVACVLLVPAVGVCLYLAIRLSFFEYDNNNADREPYVYAHTYRDLLAMVDEINYIADHNPAGEKIGIIVMSPEHWPLPWYLRDYPNTGYWGKVIDTHEPILIVHEDQVQQVEQKYESSYRMLRSYRLRPGNTLFLYVKKGVIY